MHSFSAARYRLTHRPLRAKSGLWCNYSWSAKTIKFVLQLSICSISSLYHIAYIFGWFWCWPEKKKIKKELERNIIRNKYD